MKNTKFIIAFVILIVLFTGALFIWLERRAGTLMNKQAMIPVEKQIPESDSSHNPPMALSTPVQMGDKKSPIGTLSLTVSQSAIQSSQSFDVTLSLSAPDKKSLVRM
jgi:hypothetical protein